MIRLKELLKEVYRGVDRAINLLNHLHEKRRITADYDHHDYDQMINVVPHAEKRPDIPLENFENPGKYDERPIPVKSIVSGQHTVSRDVVEGKLTGEIQNHYPHIPYAFHHKGTHYLVDGNHRANEALLKGESHMMARVIDVPDHFNKWRNYSPRPKPVGRWDLPEHEKHDTVFDSKAETQR